MLLILTTEPFFFKRSSRIGVSRFRVIEVFHLLALNAGTVIALVPVSSLPPIFAMTLIFVSAFCSAILPISPRPYHATTTTPRIPAMPLEIQQVLRIARGVAFVRHWGIKRLASVEVVSWYLPRELLLEHKWGRDECGDEAGVNVPLDVAVEEPHAWIVRSESHDDVAVWSNEEDVSSHGCLVEGGVVWVVVVGVFRRAVDGLKCEAVEICILLSV